MSKNESEEISLKPVLETCLSAVNFSESITGNNTNHETNNCVLQHSNEQSQQDTIPEKKD